MTESSPVSLIVCSSPMVCATALMNANSVPAHVEAEFKAAVQRLAIFLQHTLLLSDDLSSARQDFYRHLSRNWHPYRAAVQQKPELEYIAYADGLGYVARLHSILYEFKAFLDIFTRMACRLIAGSGGPNGFNKGKVHGVEISGGRVINWLLGHSVDRLSSRDTLATVLANASREWITNVVDLRDAMSHYRELPGLRHMRISVSNGPLNIMQEHILWPELPDGEALPIFAATLRARLCLLIAELLSLLPNIKAGLNEGWPQAERYLRE
jgi:hypothetical protein